MRLLIKFKPIFDASNTKHINDLHKVKLGVSKQKFASRMLDIAIIYTRNYVINFLKRFTCNFKRNIFRSIISYFFVNVSTFYLKANQSASVKCDSVA